MSLVAMPQRNYYNLYWNLVTRSPLTNLLNLLISWKSLKILWKTFLISFCCLEDIVVYLDWEICKNFFYKIFEDRSKNLDKIVVLKGKFFCKEFKLLYLPWYIYFVLPPVRTCTLNIVCFSSHRAKMIEIYINREITLEMA